MAELSAEDAEEAEQQETNISSDQPATVSNRGVDERRKGKKQNNASRAECRTFGRISDLTDGRRPGIIGSGHTERLLRRGRGDQSSSFVAVRSESLFFIHVQLADHSESMSSTIQSILPLLLPIANCASFLKIPREVCRRNPFTLSQYWQGSLGSCQCKPSMWPVCGVMHLALYLFRVLSVIG